MKSVSNFSKCKSRREVKEEDRGPYNLDKVVLISMKVLSKGLSITC